MRRTDKYWQARTWYLLVYLLTGYHLLGIFSLPMLCVFCLAFLLVFFRTMICWGGFAFPAWQGQTKYTKHTCFKKKPGGRSFSLRSQPDWLKNPLQNASEMRPSHVLSWPREWKNVTNVRRKCHLSSAKNQENEELTWGMAAALAAIFPPYASFAQRDRLKGNRLKDESWQRSKWQCCITWSAQCR